MIPLPFGVAPVGRALAGTQGEGHEGPSPHTEAKPSVSSTLWYNLRGRFTHSACAPFGMRGRAGQNDAVGRSRMRVLIVTCPYLWGRVASVARQVGAKYPPLTRGNPHHPLCAGAAPFKGGSSMPAPAPPRHVEGAERPKHPEERSPNFPPRDSSLRYFALRARAALGIQKKLGRGRMTR